MDRKIYVAVVAQQILKTLEFSTRRHCASFKKSVGPIHLSPGEQWLLTLIAVRKPSAILSLLFHVPSPLIYVNY